MNNGNPLQRQGQDEMRRQVAAGEWNSYCDVALLGKTRHRHLKTAAALGHREAQVTLGKWYQDDDKLDKAMLWFQTAHLNFDGRDDSTRDICFALGQCLDDKIANLIRKRGDAEMAELEAQALEYYKQAGELGHELAKGWVAQRLEKKGNRTEAVEWYSDAHDYEELFLRSDHLLIIKEVDDVIQRHKGKRGRQADDNDRDSDMVAQLEQVVDKHRKINSDYVDKCGNE